MENINIRFKWRGESYAVARVNNRDRFSMLVYKFSNKGTPNLVCGFIANEKTLPSHIMASFEREHNRKR